MAQNDSIGTARVDVVVDTSQFDAAITSAKRSVSGMSQAAQAAYNQLNSVEKRRVDSLIKQADTLSLTRQQQILYNAALKGTPTSILDALKTKLAGVAQATGTAASANEKYVMSEKARAAAMRGVPAQLTDIVSGLATGQRPFTVLLQQGGQLKDMFGGVVPAAKALGSVVLGLINPFTLAAGAGFALFTAWKSGSDEADKLNQSIILTGNYAGLTADKLASLARGLADTQGGTVGTASDTLAQINQTGQFTAKQLQMVTEAALAMKSGVGQAVDDTVQQFQKLAEDPLKASQQLDDQYHYLTNSVRDQIAALVEQGHAQDAATLAIQAFSESSVSRIGEVTTQAGYLSRAFDAVTASAKVAWDWMKNIGRDAGMSDQLADATKRLGELQAEASHGVRMEWSLSGLVDVNKEIEKTKSQINLISDQLMGQDNLSVATAAANRIKTDGDAGRKVLDAAVKQYSEITDRYKQERQKIVDATAAAIKSDPGNQTKLLGDQAKALKGLDDQYNKAIASQHRAQDGLAKPAQSIIQRIQEQIRANQQDAESTDRLTSSQRLRISVESDLAAAGGKISASSKEEIQQLLAQLDASDRTLKSYNDQAKAKEQLARLTAQLSVAEANQLAANQADLMTIGRGDQQVEQARRRLDIEKQYEDGLKTLRDSGVAENSVSYREQEQELRASRDRMLQVEQDYQQERLAGISDWKNGATAAMENFQYKASDVAGQTKDLFTSAFDGMTDSMTNFFTTGKLGIRSFATDFLKELVRIETRILVSKALTSILGAFGGGQSATGLGDALNGGANYTGPGSLSTAWNAKGGVYDSPSLSAYSGQVVSRPTLFAFARGAGVMGEAGPEAIMPLRRGSDGRLGVQAAPGGAFNMQVNVEVNMDGSGNVTTQGDAQAFGKQIGQQMKAVAQKEIANAQRPGGSLWRKN